MFSFNSEHNGPPWWMVAIVIVGLIIAIFQFSAVLSSDMPTWAKWLILTR